MNTENPAGQANVLVCVTDQPSWPPLILAGDAIAQKYNVPVKVVTVLKPGLVSSKTADVLQTLYNIAGRLGADMTVYFNDSPRADRGGARAADQRRSYRQRLTGNRQQHLYRNHQGALARNADDHRGQRAADDYLSLV